MEPARYTMGQPLTDEEKSEIKRILDQGGCMPHPEWTRAQIMNRCHEMYEELELLRKFVIDYVVEQPLRKPS